MSNTVDKITGYGSPVSDPGSSSGQESYTLPFAIVTGLFFMWGFTTCMNDILIPYLKGVFDLNHTQAMFVQFSFFGAYFVGSLLYFLISMRSGDPIGRMGYRNGIVIGLVLSALGTALFYPAAELVSYGFFLAALFILGLGFTLLQIAANPYVAILGSERTASSRLNLAQGFNSFGTTIAPLIGGFLIFRYFAGPDVSGADSVKIPYLIFAGMFLLMAIAMRLAHLPEFTGSRSAERGAGALRHRHTLLGMLAIFMYVGAEVSIGSIMISFLGLKEIAGLEPAAASTYVSFYWGGLMIGRFLGAISLSGVRSSRKYLVMVLIPVTAFLVILYLQGWQIAQNYGIFLVLSLAGFFFGRSLAARTLMVFALTSAILLLVALFTTGSVAMWTVIGIGLFNSIMWSNIFTLAIARLGKDTSQASSLLVMAIVGGAILPVLQGVAADGFGVHASFIVPLGAYLYIAWYGWRGYKVVDEIQ
ncbi:MAG: sugar MFS transporter [Bacteroidota bacterium]|jgi:FHS family L-fucose permease-like MFS transporter